MTAALVTLGLHLLPMLLLIDGGRKSSAAIGASNDETVVEVSIVTGAAMPAMANTSPMLVDPRAQFTLAPPKALAANLSDPGGAQLAESGRMGQIDKPEAAMSAQSNGAGGGEQALNARVIDPFALASLPPAPLGTDDPLWRQVVRCWLTPAQSAQVIVSVRVDSAGQISGQPIVFRAGAKTGARLTPAEREAIRALFACAPYQVVADGGYATLRFPAGG